MADLLRSRPSGPARLRALLDTAVADRSPLVLPGCYDALGARLVEQAGFDGVYMTGFGTTAGLLGRPDVGLLGLTEMVDNARRIVDAVDLPVVADADTGYGNQINVIRTVQAYERPGSPASTSKTRCCRRSAGTWRTSRSCRPPRWSARSGPRWPLGPIPISC